MKFSALPFLAASGLFTGESLHSKYSNPSSSRFGLSRPSTLAASSNSVVPTMTALTGKRSFHRTFGNPFYIDTNVKSKNGFYFSQITGYKEGGAEPLTFFVANDYGKQSDLLIENYNNLILLNAFKSSFFLKLKGNYWSDDGKFIMVTESIIDQDFSFFSGAHYHQQLSNNIRMRVFLELVHAVKKLHDNKYFHLNINPRSLKLRKHLFSIDDNFDGAILAIGDCYNMNRDLLGAIESSDSYSFRFLDNAAHPELDDFDQASLSLLFDRYSLGLTSLAILFGEANVDGILKGTFSSKDFNSFKEDLPVLFNGIMKLVSSNPLDRAIDLQDIINAIGDSSFTTDFKVQEMVKKVKMVKKVTAIEQPKNEEKNAQEDKKEEILLPPKRDYSGFRNGNFGRSSNGGKVSI